MITNATAAFTLRTVAAAAFITMLTGTGPAQAVKDEMIVTARGVEENLQEIPLSVSAFNADVIDELKLVTIDDVARFTPGFSFTSAFGRQSGSDRPSIRGVTTIANGIANTSAVGYFVDGVYLPGSPQSTELYNLERIEVIKGPQSSQFGRGTYAGAINYITRNISLDSYEGSVRATAGEDDTYEAVGWASGPIVEDQLGFYLGVGYDTFGGQFTNQATGDEVGGTETLSTTAKLLWTPVDGLDITLKGGYQTTDDDHFVIWLQPRADNNCCFRTPDAPRAREYAVGDARVDTNGINLATALLEGADGGMSGTELDRGIASLVIDYEFSNGMSFASTTGYVKDELMTGFDVSYANYDPVPFGASVGSFFQLDADEAETVQQELRLTSNQDGRLRWTGGVYYLSVEDREISNRKVDPNTGQSQLQTVSNLTTEEVENWAVFGGLDWDITNGTTVGLELRYAEDDIEVSNVVNDGTGTPQPCGPSPTCKDSFESFTPRFTIRTRVSDQVNLYANIAKGTKPGDFNATVPVDPGTGQPDESFRAVDEEEMISYEVGAKMNWLDDRLFANVALYFNDITDQQLTQNIEGPGGVPQSVLANVGATEVLGLEIETSLAFTDNLTGGLIYSYIDSEIKERFSRDQADLLGGNGTLESIQTLGDVSGNTSPRVPDHQFAVYALYDQDTRWGGFYGGLDFTYESSKFAQEHNLIETGDRELLAGRIGIRWQNFDFQIWGRNLLDNDTPLDVLRYIDRRSGSLTRCSTLPPTDPNTVCAGSSSSPRGFG
ncbi:MAG: TonB-dependent receptor, partial [Gammaproteobacteria bacterium]|nr:TonB-dependent receptor [Gammaproteobacteria bacterium]